MLIVGYFFPKCHLSNFAVSSSKPGHFVFVCAFDSLLTHDNCLGKSLQFSSEMVCPCFLPQADRRRGRPGEVTKLASPNLREELELMASQFLLNPLTITPNWAQTSKLNFLTCNVDPLVISRSKTKGSLEIKQRKGL